MNGPEHYRRAEAGVREDWVDNDTLTHEQLIGYRMTDLAEAQVHATLALAAAVALTKPSTYTHDHTAWREIAGVQQHPEEAP